MKGETKVVAHSGNRVLEMSHITFATGIFHKSRCVLSMETPVRDSDTAAMAIASLMP